MTAFPGKTWTNLNKNSERNMVYLRIVRFITTAARKTIGLAMPIGASLANRMSRNFRGLNIEKSNRLWGWVSSLFYMVQFRSLVEKDRNGAD